MEDCPPPAPPRLRLWKLGTPAWGRRRHSPREPLIPHVRQVRPSPKTLITPAVSLRLRTSPAAPRAPEVTSHGGTRASSRTRTTAGQRGLSTAATCTEVQQQNKRPLSNTSSPHLNPHRQPPLSHTQRLPQLRPISSPPSHPTRLLCPLHSPRQNRFSITLPKGRTITPDHHSRPKQLRLNMCPPRRDQKLLRSQNRPHQSPRPIQTPPLRKHQSSAPHLARPHMIQSATAWTPASRCSSRKKGQNCCRSWRSETRIPRYGWREVPFPPPPLSFRLFRLLRAAHKVACKIPVPQVRAWRISARRRCLTRKTRSRFRAPPRCSRGSAHLCRTRWATATEALLLRTKWTR